MSRDIIWYYRLNKPQDIINSSNKVYNFFAFVSLGYYYDFMLIAIIVVFPGKMKKLLRAAKVRPVSQSAI